jgi:hypothetical protein
MEKLNILNKEIEIKYDKKYNNLDDKIKNIDKI